MKKHKVDVLMEEYAAFTAACEIVSGEWASCSTAETQEEFFLGEKRRILQMRKNLPTFIEFSMYSKDEKKSFLKFVRSVYHVFIESGSEQNFSQVYITLRNLCEKHGYGTF